MLRGIEERIAAAVGLPEPNGEGMQILRYERGQKYDPHYDYFHDAANSSPKRGGQRMATMLIYLRDTEKGGETIFPKGTKPADFDDPDAGALEWSECASKTGVPVRSVRGDAVLFWSLTEEYSLDAGSLHGACPVAGEKWTAVKWIRVAKFDGVLSSPLPAPPLAVSDRKAADPEGGVSRRVGGVRAEGEEGMVRQEPGVHDRRQRRERQQGTGVSRVVRRRVRENVSTQTER